MTSTVGATTVDSDYVPCNYSGDTTWYKFSSSTDTHLLVDTAGSVNEISYPYDTTIHIFRAGSGGSLNFVDCNDNPVPSVPQAKLAFAVQAGVDYYIEIAGVNGTSGSLHLSVTYASLPANDDFSSATSVSLSSPYVDQQTIADATWQYYEPLPCYIGTDSVWYTYTPSTNHRLHISTYGSSFDTVVVVYTGTSLTSLSAIA